MTNMLLTTMSIAIAILAIIVISIQITITLTVTISIIFSIKAHKAHADWLTVFFALDFQNFAAHGFRIVVRDSCGLVYVRALPSQHKPNPMP